MLDTEHYIKYKRTKENLKISYKSYDLEKILATDILFQCYKNKIKFNKQILFENLFTTYILSAFKEKIKTKGILFTFSSYYGNDHRELLNSITKEVEHSIIFEEDFKRVKIINIRNIFSTFWEATFKLIKLKGSLNDKLLYFTKIVFYKNLIDEIEKCTTVNINKFVPFLSSINMDPIYCQFFRKRNIPSFAIQHGTHCAPQQFKIFIPLDVVNIENFQADYMLGWGEFTKEALIKGGFDKKCYLLAGHPKYSDSKKIILKNNQFKSCVINLARDLYSKGNRILLNIATNLIQSGYKIFIKMHPRSDINLYLDIIGHNDFTLLPKEMVIHEVIKEINPDFAIVYNSTVYYEYYINNIIAFRFTLEENEIPFGLDDGFTTTQELFDKIDVIKKADNYLLDQEANKMVNKYCSLGVNNYSKILEN